MTELCFFKDIDSLKDNFLKGRGYNLRRLYGRLLGANDILVLELAGSYLVFLVMLIH